MRTSFFEKTLPNAAKPGDLFEDFLAKLLANRFPGIRGFPPGKDGAIDLVYEDATGLTVVEAKYIGGTAKPVDRWREVERHLQRHLLEKDKPDKPYGPWLRTQPPIIAYYFCTTTRFQNQEARQGLKERIQTFLAVNTLRLIGKQHRITVKGNA